MAEGMRWGYDLGDWERAREQARGELRRRAASRRTISYSELCDSITVARFRPYSWSLMALLGEICSIEDAERGVMLASLVVRADTGMPGRGYFAHAEGLGRDVSDERGFWESEAERVFAAYKSHEA